MRIHRSLARLGVASLLGGLATLATATRADAAGSGPPCDLASLTCSVGSAALRADIKTQLPTVIDSGMMGSGLVQIRTKFTVNPVGTDPLFTVDMPTGAQVQASWSEKGYVQLATVTQPSAKGTMSVHYTLVPSLGGSIYGVGLDYDATSLVNLVPGAAFHYDAKASMPIAPWGFAGASLPVAAPALDQSTIFALPFSTLGVSTDIAEGTLAIQASAKPTFNYVTKNVRLDSGTITSDGGTAKVAIGDEDFLDLSATVSGELTLGGTLDIKPVVTVTTVDGYPTFGLTKFSFSAVTKPISDGKPIAVSFGNQQIHVPLPNIKVPSADVMLGSVKPGQRAQQTVTIASTGELGGRLTFASSDPQFTVPSGEVKVGSKSQYALTVGFAPSSDSGATATITVKSNDPDSPEQTFRVAGNGASLPANDPMGGDSDGTHTGGSSTLDPPTASSGCSAAPAPARGASVPGLAGLAVGLGLLVAARRRARR